MNDSQVNPDIPARRVLNTKAVAICGVVLLVVSAGMSRLHSRQVVATTQFLKQRADDAVSAGRPHESVRALELYLSFNGGDTAARRELSEMISEHGTGEDALQTAYRMNEDLLLNNTDDRELRLRQARLAVQLRRLSDANSHLAALRTTHVDDGEVWYLSGVVAERMGQDDRAESCLLESLQRDASQADACALLARLRDRRHIPVAETRQLFEDLVAQHPSADAFRVQAAWLQQHELVNDAVAALWSGLRLLPGDVSVNGMLLATLQSATQQQLNNRLRHQQDFIRHLQQQVGQSPANFRLRAFAAHAYWNAGDKQSAVELLKDGIARDPQAWRLQEMLIENLVSLGQTQEAESALARLPRTAVSHATWHFLRGRVQMGLSDWSRAADSFEQAHGFAKDNTQLRRRARLCQAVCHREQGQTTGAVDTYRAMLQANPSSRDGRLGMAAARLESGQIDLAIAEYRQLLDVPGVPELLASLLIQETLRQPATRRNWREVEALLQNGPAVIADDTQRQLLKADLAFAQGRPADALRQLDDLAMVQPSAGLAGVARRRLLTDRSGGLLQRMMIALEQNSDSQQAHIVIVRMKLHQHGVNAAVEWVRQIRTGSPTSGLQQTSRLQLTAQVAESVAIDLQRLGQMSEAAALLDESQTAWRRLADHSPGAWPLAAGFLARHRDPNTVIQVLEGLPASINGYSRTQTWLAALRNLEAKEQLRQLAEAALRNAVISDPSDMRLLQAYVELLVQFSGYDGALAVARQVLQQQPDNAAALGQCAWILTMTGQNHAEAMRMSEQASRFAPGNANVRTIRGLVLSRSTAPADALPVFQSIPHESRSQESYVYEAWTLLQTGHGDAAGRMVAQLRRYASPGRWRPADRQLLQELLTRVSRTDSRSAIVH